MESICNPYVTHVVTMVSQITLSATSFLLCSAEPGSKNVAFTSFYFSFILHVFASRCRSTVHTRMLFDGYGSPQIQKLRVNMFSLNQVAGGDHES